MALTRLGDRRISVEMPFRILVVDDYEPFRRYVCQTVEGNEEFQVIRQASDGLEAIKKATNCNRI